VCTNDSGGFMHMTKNSVIPSEAAQRAAQSRDLIVSPKQ